MNPQQGTVTIKLHQALLQTGEATAAERLLLRSLKRLPEDGPLNLYAGSRELIARRPDWALAYYLTAARQEPGNAAAHNNLAWTLHRLNDPAALSVVNEAFRLAPRSAPTIDTLATILTDSNQLERSLDLHQQAARLAPQMPEIRLRYAQALIKAGGNSTARADLTELIGQFSGSVQAVAATKALHEMR